MILEIIGPGEYDDQRFYSAHGEAEPHEIVSLKPCPFCGGEDLEVSNTQTPLYMAQCQDCGGSVNGDFIHGAMKSRSAAREVHKQAFKSACDRWNTRVPDQG